MYWPLEIFMGVGALLLVIGIVIPDEKEKHIRKAHNR